VAGLHRSLGGKLPNAYKGRFDVTTSQLALCVSQPKILKKPKLINTMIRKLIIVLNEFKEKFLFRFLKKASDKFVFNLNIN
tara:strand:- start:439 stop:681 length:243 start_codon:yes stop_codon:yes gene_type:complete